MDNFKSLQIDNNYSMETDTIELLRKSGLKVTPQRIAVLRLLSKGGHYNGEQIYEELKKTEPSISLSTVYNTLEALEKAGIINSFEAGGITWYEMRRVPHINIFCVDTNEILDAEANVETIYKQLEEKGIKVKSLSIVAYSECANLKERSEGS